MKRRNGIMTFRLPDEEKAMLQAHADAKDVSLSDLAVMAVRDLLAKLDSEKEQPKKGKK